MNWDDLRVFLVAAEAGSLGKAAKKLRLSPATVWRRLRSLEESLGMTLFERRRSGYVLAPSGAALLGSLGHLPATIADARTALDERRSNVDAEIRIAVPEFLAILLAMDLPALAEQHPRLVVEIVSGSPFAGIEVRDADIVVSYLEPVATGYRPVFTVATPFGLYASRQYLKRFGSPNRFDALAGHRLVAFDHAFSHVAPPAWQKGQPWGAEIAARCSSPHARVAAVAAGLGLGMLPVRLAALHPGLQMLFGPDAIGSLELRGFLRQDLRKVIYLESVVAFVRAAFDARDRSRQR